MHRIGNNRFYWPQNADICWYEKDDILAVIPPPSAVTARHMQVDVQIWSALCDKPGACISKQSLKIFLTTSLLKTNEGLTETQRKPLFGISKHFVKGSLDLDGELA